jgi:cytidyltransferase-like protein
MTKNILITGSFDLLHSGHVAFLKQAAEYGNLYVGIGSDKSIEQLKNRPTINKQDERLFMVQSIKYVHHVWINSGIGNMDFTEDIEYIMGSSEFKLIDIMIVNEDQDFPEKREFCRKREIEYIILQRKPEPGLPQRSSTQMREYYDK